MTIQIKDSGKRTQARVVWKWKFWLDDNRKLQQKLVPKKIIFIDLNAYPF